MAPQTPSTQTTIWRERLFLSGADLIRNEFMTLDCTAGREIFARDQYAVPEQQHPCPRSHLPSFNIVLIKPNKHVPSNLQLHDAFLSQEIIYIYLHKWRLQSRVGFTCV
jgi:hypothetical protein